MPVDGVGDRVMVKRAKNGRKNLRAKRAKRPATGVFSVLVQDVGMDAFWTHFGKM